MGKTAKTLDPTKQNYQTIDSVLGAYQSLAQSKLNMLNQQATAARHQTHGTPPVSGAGAGATGSITPPGATHVVPGPDGHNHYTNAAGTVDLGIAP